jgi:hypothetical protein
MTTTELQDIRKMARIGVEHCRRGEWKNGLKLLGAVAENGHENTDLPGVSFSYLGYGVARYQGKLREGLALCEHAVKVEFYEPDNYMNLAAVELLRKNRRKAARAVREGLRLDPGHRGLHRLLQEMGRRRQPVVPFLNRNNPVNRLLGRARHQLRQS